MCNNVNWNRNQPIILCLREVLPRVFPVLHTRVGVRRVVHRSGIGGYVNRTTVTGSPSAHSQGRAADIFLDANNPTEKQVADNLFYMFRTFALELGVDHVIWNRQIWSNTRGGPRVYSNSPHTNHVHVAFTRAGSQLRPPSLEMRLRNLALNICQ